MPAFPSHLSAHFLRLGITPPATRAQLAAAYRAAALKHHPDRGGEGKTFAAITDSYETLLRHSHRVNYRPASLRSHADAHGHDDSPFFGMVPAVIIPSVMGIIVGVRLVLFGGEREGLRAGGASRFVPDETATKPRSP